MNPATVLEWYQEMGVTDAVQDMPVNRLAPTPIPETMPQGNAGSVQIMATPPMTPMLSPKAGMKEAEAIALACQTLEELEQAVRSFEGCALKRTATHTVFAQGVANAPIMVIGEAPGADEDRAGIPFCGVSGQLLDKMLAAIGVSRNSNALITNMLYWRPPGNRKPSTEEVALCLPFVRRHIQLLKPKLVILSGGTSASAMLNSPMGITRLRGKLHQMEVEPGVSVPTYALYHPSYLLRQPAHKRYAWQDLLAIKKNLFELQVVSS